MIKRRWLVPIILCAVLTPETGAASGRLEIGTTQGDKTSTYEYFDSGVATIAVWKSSGSGSLKGELWKRIPYFLDKKIAQTEVVDAEYGGYQTTVDLKSGGHYYIKVIDQDGYASGYVKAINYKPDGFIVP